MAANDLIELGSTGLKRQGGYIYEEYLPELQGVKWLAAIRRMIDEPVLGAILYAIESLVGNVEWNIVPTEPTRKDDVAAATFIADCWKNFDEPFSDIMAEILTMFPYGFAPLEIVYTRRPDGKIGWRTWAIRAQDTVTEWLFSERGDVTGLVQMAPPNYRPVTIPAEKLLLFRTTSQRGNPEGRSLFRPAYNPWYFKVKLANIEGIGVERDLAGLPVAHVPPELLSANANPTQKAILASIREIVTNIRRDEQEGVIWPMAYDNEGRLVYKLELLASAGTRQFDTGEIIKRYQQEMVLVTLGDFILLGHENVGSYSLASSKTAMFVSALGVYLKRICGVINRHAIPRLLALNGMSGRAICQHGDIETMDLDMLGNYISNLAGVGVPLDAPNIAQYLRDQAGIPRPETQDTK